MHALAHIVYDILTAVGDESTLLCAVAKNGDWIPVENCHVIADVRANSKILKLDLQSIDPNLVGAHYLRAGGAMALTLHGYDYTTIMKMGRWTSPTFLQYIHNQIAHCCGETANGRSREARARQIAHAEEPRAQDARATKQARPETKKQEGTRVKIRLS